MEILIKFVNTNYQGNIGSHFMKYLISSVKEVYWFNFCFFSTPFIT